MSEFHHLSVLLRESVDGLNVRPDGVYVDGTLGGGGHSAEIAKRLKTGKLIGIDKDKQALTASAARLAGFGAFEAAQGDFGDMAELLARRDIEKVDGILLDLGVSSHQLDTAERGFSYHNDAPLDMRMSGAGTSARDVINTYTVQELARIFASYGEEKYAKSIARGIERARAARPVETTGQLAEIIKTSIPAAARRDGHPAKRVFQAVRIEVNGELDSLRRFLDRATDLLKPGGRLAVITFHSLEDRMVKQAFANAARGCTCPPDFPICVCGKTPAARLVNRKPILPGEEELRQNKRSRSAKLRVLEKA